MRDIGNNGGSKAGQSPGPLEFARDVLDRLAKRRVGGGMVVHAGLLDSLVNLAHQADPGAARSLLNDARRLRVPTAEMLRSYIPDAARAMGLAWAEDRMSFGQVTIGAAQLQVLVHQLLTPGADDADPFNAATVLMIVPPGEQHTLGALVATAELRALGISVRLEIAPTGPDLCRLLTAGRFDAALISLGSGEKLEICMKLVKTIKRHTKGQVRIAVGGSVAEDYRTVLLQSGADLVTTSVRTMLAEFGLGCDVHGLLDRARDRVRLERFSL